MYDKSNKLSTVQTAQTTEKIDSSSLHSKCMTRMMTPEDWEKYGPLITGKSKKMQKSNVI